MLTTRQLFEAAEAAGSGERSPLELLGDLQVSGRGGGRGWGGGGWRGTGRSWKEERKGVTVRDAAVVLNE